MQYMYNYNMYEYFNLLIVVMPKHQIKISREFSPVDFTVSFYAFADPETKIKNHKVLILKILF